MKTFTTTFAMAIVFCVFVTAKAQTLQTALDDNLVSSRWNYDDWDVAQAAAVKSKKPILALFR